MAKNLTLWKLGPPPEVGPLLKIPAWGPVLGVLTKDAEWRQAMKEELEPRASEENTFTQDVQGTSRGPLIRDSFLLELTWKLRPRRIALTKAGW